MALAFPSPRYLRGEAGVAVCNLRHLPRRVATVVAIPVPPQQQQKASPQVGLMLLQAETSGCHVGLTSTWQCQLLTRPHGLVTLGCGPHGSSHEPISYGSPQTSCLHPSLVIPGLGSARSGRCYAVWPRHAPLLVLCLSAKKRTHEGLGN